MSSKNNLLVNLENAGVYQSPKWLTRGVSLEVRRGQIVTLIGLMVLGRQQQLKWCYILEPDEGSMKRYTDKIAYVPQKINIDWTMPLRVVDFMRLTNNLSDNEVSKTLNQTGVETQGTNSWSIWWRISTCPSSQSYCKKTRITSFR